MNWFLIKEKLPDMLDKKAATQHKNIQGVNLQLHRDARRVRPVYLNFQTLPSFVFNVFLSAK